MLALSEEEEKFWLRMRQIINSHLVDEVTIRLHDLAIVEKRSKREEVFRPIAQLTDSSKR